MPFNHGLAMAKSRQRSTGKGSFITLPVILAPNFSNIGPLPPPTYSFIALKKGDRLRLDSLESNIEKVFCPRLEQHTENGAYSISPLLKS